MIKHVDKNSIKHFIVCYWLSASLGIEGASLALGASITKEWCDKLYAGHWCWWDLSFDMMGIAFGILTHYLFFKKLSLCN
jgi:hypothetical protein